MSCFRPILEDLERRRVYSVVFDIDTGAEATLFDGRPTPGNISTYPRDFTTGVSGPPVINYKHGSLMAQQAIDAGYTNKFIELKAVGADGFFSVDSIVACETWVAKQGRKLYPRQKIVVVCPAAGAGDNTTDAISGSIPFLWPEKKLARLGIPVVLAAGNGGTNIDTSPWFPAASALYAHPKNVLVVTATDTSHHLQDYSNYGPMTVNVAAQTPYGTSGAAILGAVATSRVMTRLKTTGVKLARDAIATVTNESVRTAALTGLIQGGELTP